MFTNTSNIISQLKKEILSLEGFSSKRNADAIIKLGPIDDSFPNKIFPTRGVHEFLCKDNESISASNGFVAGILSALMKNNGAALWLCSNKTIFPPALKSFDIDTDKIIFVNLQRQNEILWVIEEALKCEGLAGVVGEVQELNFTESRRFQLAVEKSNVTGFILRHNTRNLNTTACITRWRITSLQSDPGDRIPGVGFPRWKVELLKVRSGQPGSWDIEWREGSFRYISKALLQDHLLLEKTG